MEIDDWSMGMWDDLFKDSLKELHSTFCIVIEIKNNNPINLQNIEIGNANINLLKENFGLPPNITVTCKTKLNNVEKEITYEQYLSQSKSYAFKVGLIYVGNPMGYIFEPSLITLDFKKKLIAALDPYRQKYTFYRHVLNKEFFVNGEEKIVIDELPSKSICIFQLYVSEKININRTLNSYAPPQITKCKN